jgi:hypothetical protein
VVGDAVGNWTRNRVCDHINYLALKYTGHPVFQGDGNSKNRLMYRVAPDHVHGR